MRPSSLLGASTATNSSTSTGSAAAANASVDNPNAAQNLANQFGNRPRVFNDFGFEISGTPGVLEEGLMVRQRQELIRLPDVSKMLAEIKIEEARVAQVKAGMTAYISVRNIPHRQFKGTVRRVGLLPDAQASWLNPDKKVFATDVLVDEELPILKPGVSANVEIIITNLTKVLSVPIQTVARLDGQNVCFIKKGMRVTPVPVTTGWFNDAFVEITAGLKEGDRLQFPHDRSRSQNQTRKAAGSNAALPRRWRAKLHPNGHEIARAPDGARKIPRTRPNEACRHYPYRQRRENL